jgi:hypothetical protein
MFPAAIIGILLPGIIQATKKGQSTWSSATIMQKEEWIKYALDRLTPEHNDAMQLVGAVYNVFEYNGLFKGRPVNFPDFFRSNPGIINQAVERINAKPADEKRKTEAANLAKKQKQTGLIVLSILGIALLIYSIW